MRNLLLLLTATATLSACAAAAPAGGETAAPASAAAEPVTPPAAAKPEIGSFGFDFAGMDRDAAPGDNFYSYANGTWARTTPIPADKSNYGMFTVLDDLSKKRTQEILEQAKDEQTSKIGNAYASFLDEAAVEAKGLEPIRPWLDRIKSLDSKAGYAALAAAADRNGVQGPFASAIGQDDKQPDVYAITLIQAGLGMPDRDYYLSKDAELAKTRAAYLAHLEKMFALAGEPNGPARAKALLDFETGIAKAHWTRIDSRDATKTYNKMTLAQLAALAPGFDFGTYFKDLGANVDYAIVAQPSAVKGIAALVRS
ncbi:MAG: M13 family peptidase, partial [Sphingomonadales bacterium]